MRVSVCMCERARARACLYMCLCVFVDGICNVFLSFSVCVLYYVAYNIAFAASASIMNGTIRYCDALVLVHHIVRIFFFFVIAI